MPKHNLHLGSILISSFLLICILNSPTKALIPATHWMSYGDGLDNQHFFSVGYVNPTEESHGLGVGFHYDFSESDQDGFPYVRGTVFWDQRASPQNIILKQEDIDHQLSVNFEWHASDWSLHANSYLPSPATYKTHDPVDITYVGFDGYRLGFHHYHLQPSQSVTPGTDLRLAYWWPLGENANLRSESTVYRYNLPDGNYAMGTIAETAIAWTPKDQDWTLHFSVQERIDTMKEPDMYAGVQISIPLGQPPKKSAQANKTWHKLNSVAQAPSASSAAKKSSSLRPILRNYGITQYQHLQIDHDFSPAINPFTGQPYGKVIFVAQNATGNGMEHSPTSLSQAMAMADNDGIIVMEGSKGSIHSPQPIQVGQYAMLVGGGYQFPIYDLEGRHGIAKLGQRASPIFITQAQQPALTLQGYAQAHRIDITGGTVGIHIHNGQHISLSDVEVGGTRAAGMVIDPSQSVSLQNCRIRHTTTEGVIANNLDQLCIANMRITNTGQTGLVINNTNHVNAQNLIVEHSFADGATFKDNGQVKLSNIVVDETWVHGLVIENSSQIQVDQIHLHNHGGHGLWLKGTIAESQWGTTQIDYARQNAVQLEVQDGNHVFDRLGIYESCTTGINCPSITPAHINIKNLKMETKQGIGLYLADNSPNIIINQGDINKETWTDYRFKTPVLIGDQPGSIANVIAHQPPHPNAYLYNQTQSAQDYYTWPEPSAIFAETTWRADQDHFFKADYGEANSFFSK